VTVETASATPLPIQFQFDPNISAGSDLLLEYQITGGISGVGLAVALTGTGFVNETVCTIFESTGVCPTVDALAILSVSGEGSNPESVTAGLGGDCTVGCTSSTTGGVANVTFPTQTEVWIIKDVNSGSAAFSEVEQTYSNAPEPMTMSLMGAGLLGLGLLGRRKLGK
jgi:hypothetical protein